MNNCYSTKKLQVKFQKGEEKATRDVRRAEKKEYEQVT